MNSGIKKPILIVEALIFLVLIVGGYIGAFFLIKTDHPNWGGTLIFLTSLIVFFSFMGYKAIRGTQLDRVNAYMEKHSESFSDKVKPLRYQFVSSFNKGTFIHFKFN
jgi:hypothetical protein